MIGRKESKEVDATEKKEYSNFIGFLFMSTTTCMWNTWYKCNDSNAAIGKAHKENSGETKEKEKKKL